MCSTSDALDQIIIESVECVVQARIPSSHGAHRVLLYNIPHTQNIPTKSEFKSENNGHMALVFGPYTSSSLLSHKSNDTEFKRLQRGCNLPTIGTSTQSPLVRIHSCCFTGETLGSTRCDCAEQLQEAMKLMALSSGIIVYLKQEGRGIGLHDKLLAYNLIDNGYDTLTANIALGHRGDLRDYKIASLILQDLGLQSCTLLTNNPDKVRQLGDYGIKVDSTIPMVPASWSQSTNLMLSQKQQPLILQDRDLYLRTKVKKMGHTLIVPVEVETSILNSPLYSLLN